MPVTTYYEVVRLGYTKLCMSWFPKMLTEKHKRKRIGFALDFFTYESEAGEELFNHIVTDDEKLVYH